MTAHSNPTSAWNPPVRRTDPPNPDWDWGDTVDRTELGREWLKGAEGGWESWDASQMGLSECFSILTSSVVPRPIAMVSTTSKDGIDNVAPYSLFTVACPMPPVLVFTCEMYERRKDTHRNILSTGEFVINTSSEAFAEAVHVSAIESPADVEEWGFAGLTKIPSDTVRPPRIRESGVSFECKFLQSVPVTDPRTNVVVTEVIFGTVQKMHVRKDMLTHSPNSKRPQVMPDVLRPIAKLGEASYTSLGDMYRLGTLDWKRDGEKAMQGARRRKEREGCGIEHFPKP